MKQIFKFICCGSVDDGKSTLIGRLLLDTGNVKTDQLEDAKKASLKNGSSRLEPAMLLDGLLDERAQQITIDVAHRYFDYQQIRFHILDCPGHIQYTKNMAVAAAQAQAAIVVIDVTKGIREQTKNHIRICDLFHIPFVCVCLTKCDLLPGKGVFLKRKPVQKLTREVKMLLRQYHFKSAVLPVSAIRDCSMKNVLQILCSQAQIMARKISKQKERVLHVSAAKSYRGKRYYYAREVSGLEIKPGKYWVYPQHLPLTISKIVSPGCFQIKEDVDIAPGDCIANTAPYINNLLSHQTIWFDTPTKSLLLKHGSRLARVVHYTADTLELDQPILFHNIEDVKMNGFGIFMDEVSKKTLGCCVFVGNQKIQKTTFSTGKTYWMENTTKEFQASAKAVLGISAYLEMDILQKVLCSKKESTFSAVSMLAHLLNEQGLTVGILIPAGQKGIQACKANPFPGIWIKVTRNYVHISRAGGQQLSLPLSAWGTRRCTEEIKKRFA